MSVQLVIIRKYNYKKVYIYIYIYRTGFILAESFWSMGTCVYIYMVYGITWTVIPEMVLVMKAGGATSIIAAFWGST